MTRYHSKNLIVIWENGAPGGTRTPDLLVRSQTLYPAELRARRVHCSLQTVYSTFFFDFKFRYIQCNRVVEFVVLRFVLDGNGKPLNLWLS